jgi:hypothetical protein
LVKIEKSKYLSTIQIPKLTENTNRIGNFTPMRITIFALFLSHLTIAQSYFTPREVYDFAVGDTLEYSISGGITFTQLQEYGITRHSIQSKTYNIDSSEICYFSNTYSFKRTWNSSNGSYDTIRWSGTSTWCYTNLDSNLRYLPNYNHASITDTVELSNSILQNCSTPSPIYYLDTIEDYFSLGITSPAQVFTMSENCAMQQYVNEVFKPGFGKIRSHSIQNSDPQGLYQGYNDTNLVYMVKNGISYGYKDPVLGMQPITKPLVQIIENPVSTHLLINGYTGSISILDAMGRILYQTDIIEGGFPVDFLTKGNYYLQLGSQGTTLKFLKL